MMIRLEARDFLTDALYLYHIRCSICKPYDIAAQSNAAYTFIFQSRARPRVTSAFHASSSLPMGFRGHIFSHVNMALLAYEYIVSLSQSESVQTFHGART